jgi:hypothetical protein
MTMERILKASDIVTAIQETLIGTRTKEELGNWAHKAMVRDDSKVVPYDYRHLVEIHDALMELLYMSEGPEYYLEDNELRAIIDKLESLK